MKIVSCRSCIWIASALFMSATLARATESGFDWFKPFSKLTGEYSVEETYVGNANVKRGSQEVDFSESDTILRFILTPRVKLGVLRLGAEWERFTFDMPKHAPLPDTLQSAAIVLGIDTQLSDSILMRFEATPGFYGTNRLDFDEFNVPFIAGGTYIYNPNIQFIVGVSVDIERKYPVLPAAGIRWKVSRLWLLNASLPEPRIEFEAAKNVALYLGATFKETSFRVADDFSSGRKGSRLNRAVLTYSEVRTGVGADWKITPTVTFSAEAGYQPYRSFDFYRLDLRYHEDGSAPYGMASLHGAF
jgi:hypothetical protein